MMLLLLDQSCHRQDSQLASNEDLYLDDDALMKNPDLVQDEHLLIGSD